MVKYRPNMSLFYKDGLHLIENENGLLAKKTCALKNLWRSKKFIQRCNIAFIKPFQIPSTSFRTLNIKPSNDKKNSLIKKAVYYQQISHSCKHVFMYVSTSRGYMLPTSTDDVFVPNINSCIKSSQSPFTFPSVSHVCLTTSAHNNVIKKPITCRDSVTKRPRKCLRKSTIVKNRCELCQWICS